MKYCTHWRGKTVSARRSTTSGFTLLELLIITTILGILAIVATPSWLTFLGRYRLNAAHERALNSVRQAQSTAKLRKADWQASFQEINGTVYWAVHPANVNVATVPWQPLGGNVSVDRDLTTLRFSSNVWQVRFNYKGNVDGQLGKLTLFTRQQQRTRRCVVISTLLGGIRSGQETASTSANCN